VNPLPVRFHPAARRELVRAVEYYNQRATELGNDLAAEVKTMIREIQEYPELGSPGAANIRRVLVRRFPFSLVYRMRDDAIVVLALSHHRRKPGYWQHRL
jgi:toxin ParE1/3/4